MSTEKITNKTIESFQWDESVSEIDFFGETTTNPSTKVEDVVKEIEEDGKQKEKPTSIDKEEPEIDFFGENDKVEEGKEKPDTKIEEEADDEDVEQDKTINNVTTLKFLKDKGIIDFELEEGEDLDEEDAEVLLTEKFEESVEKRFEESIANLPDSVKNIVRFATQGGDVESMLSELAKPREKGISKSMDLENESNQEKMVKYQLEKDGYDEEYIETHIEVLKDSGKLKSIAEKHFSKWSKEEELKEKTLVDRQKQAKLEAKQNQINFRNEIAEHLNETESVNNLKFSKSDLKELPDYISNSSIKLEDGRQTTPFYKDLFEAMKDKDKLLVLAKLVKNNFDFKDIEKEVVTKQTQKIKDNIQRQKEGKKIKSAGSSQSPKRLADYFN